MPGNGGIPLPPPTSSGKRRKRQDIGGQFRLQPWAGTFTGFFGGAARNLNGPDGWIMLCPVKGRRLPQKTATRKLSPICNPYDIRS